MTRLAARPPVASRVAAVRVPPVPRVPRPRRGRTAPGRPARSARARPVGWAPAPTRPAGSSAAERPPKRPVTPTRASARPRPLPPRGAVSSTRDRPGGVVGREHERRSGPADHSRRRARRRARGARAARHRARGRSGARPGVRLALLLIGGTGVSRQSTLAWLAAALAVLVPAGLATNDADAQDTLAGSQGTDTSLALTDSAVTVRGRDQFAVVGVHRQPDTEPDQPGGVDHVDRRHPDRAIGEPVHGALRADLPVLGRRRRHQSDQPGPPARTVRAGSDRRHARRRPECRSGAERLARPRPRDQAGAVGRTRPTGRAQPARRPDVDALPCRRRHPDRRSGRSELRRRHRRQLLVEPVLRHRHHERGGGLADQPQRHRGGADGGQHRCAVVGPRLRAAPSATPRRNDEGPAVLDRHRAAR